jgi:hypothetical protein
MIEEILTIILPYIFIYFALWLCIIIPFLLFTETGQKLSRRLLSNIRSD